MTYVAILIMSMSKAGTSFHTTSLHHVLVGPAHDSILSTPNTHHYTNVFLALKMYTSNL
jgi:hypothetical protein